QQMFSERKTLSRAEERDSSALSASRGGRMDRKTCTDVILVAKKAKGVSFQELAGKIGRHVVWTTAAIMGQATMDADEAETVTALLGLGPEVSQALQEIPAKGSLEDSV